MPVLAVNVVVRDKDGEAVVLAAGTDVPAWAKKQIKNPDVYVTSGSAPEPPPATTEEPPPANPPAEEPAAETG